MTCGLGGWQSERRTEFSKGGPDSVNFGVTADSKALIFGGPMSRTRAACGGFRSTAIRDGLGMWERGGSRPTIVWGLRDGMAGGCGVSACGGRHGPSGRFREKAGRGPRLLIPRHAPMDPRDSPDGRRSAFTSDFEAALQRWGQRRGYEETQVTTS